MYKAILVARTIQAGQRVLDALRKSVEISAAFWLWFDEEQQWRLVVVSPDVASRGPRSVYTMLSTVLYDLANDPQSPVNFQHDHIRLVTPNSLLYKQVKLGTGLMIASGPERDIQGEDVYVYWI